MNAGHHNDILEESSFLVKTPISLTSNEEGGYSNLLGMLNLFQKTFYFKVKKMTGEQKGFSS